MLPAVSEERHIFKPLEKDVYDERIIASLNLNNYVSNFAEICTSVPFKNFLWTLSKCYLVILNQIMLYLIFFLFCIRFNLYSQNL